jgi:ribosome-associated toxin RatA of RatAB toxin-antitoxin module
MCPQAAQRRRCTHQPPAASHSMQPVPLGGTAGSTESLTPPILVGVGAGSRVIWIRTSATVVYCLAMATKDSREVVIDATPEQILDVIADVEATPSWSPQYQKAEILDSYDNGRPKQVKMTVKAAGITDEQIIEYTWGDDKVAWTLVSAGQLKAQDASYTLTPEGDKTRVKFEIAIDLSIPMPGFLLKRTLKGGLETATDGLKKQVNKVLKG